MDMMLVILEYIVFIIKSKYTLVNKLDVYTVRNKKFIIIGIPNNITKTRENLKDQI